MSYDISIYTKGFLDRALSENHHVWAPDENFPEEIFTQLETDLYTLGYLDSIEGYEGEPTDVEFLLSLVDKLANKEEAVRKEAIEALVYFAYEKFYEEQITLDDWPLISFLKEHRWIER